MIKYFKINGLFGDRDVSLKLNNLVNIYVGENGLGKTTILNIINSILKLDFFSLAKIPFESVLIKTNDKQKTIPKQTIIEVVGGVFPVNDIEFRRHPLRYKMRRREVLRELLTYENIKTLDRLYQKYEASGSLRHFYNRVRFDEIDYDSNIIELFEYLEGTNLLKKVLDIYSFVDELNESILYFPTFRRIETDLQNLDLPDDSIKKFTKNKVINFGMDDVEILLNNKLSEISTGIKQGFNKMALTLLNTYVYQKDLNVDKVNENELNFIFSILSNEINDSLKAKINEIISNNEVDGKAYKNNETLINFLNELLSIYQSQVNNIESIDNFITACNSYFTNKKCTFDKENLKVTIELLQNKSNNMNNSISFGKLSSGEKQIVSLFSKLYLAEKEKYFILFDEPELSLSIDWQRKLIPDIMNSKRCSQMIIVTHSPFIFDNEYKIYAKALSDTFGR